MAERRVSIEIEGKVNLQADATKARQELESLRSPFVGNGQPIPAAGHTEPQAATKWMSDIPPEQFAIYAQRLMATVASRLPTSLTSSELKRLEDKLSRADFYSDQAGRQDLKDALDALRKTLEDRKGDLERDKDQSGGGGSNNGGGRGGNGGGDHGGGSGGFGGQFGELGGNAIQGMLSRYLGPAGGMLGSLMTKFLGNPLVMGAGVMTAANMAFTSVDNALTAAQEPARNEFVGYADLARQYGIDKDLFNTFRPQSENFRTNSRFRKYGFNAAEAARVAAIYDRPGTEGAPVNSMLNDVSSILAFSRTMGIDEAQSAQVAKTLGMAGVGGARGGNAEEGMRVLKAAMMEGIKDGIASSDTMNSLVQFARMNYSEGRATNAKGMAWFASMVDKANNTNNPALRGQNAAGMVQGMIDGLSAPQDMGMLTYLTSAMGSRSAKSIGLEGKEAEGYEAIRKRDPMLASKYLLDRLRSGKNPALFQEVLGSFDAAFEGTPDLQARAYQQYFNWSSSQALEAVGAGGASKLFKNDPTRVEQFFQGGGKDSDVQANNEVEHLTRDMNIADSDRELVKSLANLSALGPMKEFLNTIKDKVNDIYAWISKNPNSSGSLRGKVREPRSYNSEINAEEEIQNVGNPDNPTPVTTLELPGSMEEWFKNKPSLQSMSDIGVRTMAGGAEATNPAAINETTGAFGYTQIMATNLKGLKGWDRTYMNTEDARINGFPAWFEMNDLNPKDPIPDNLITGTKASRLQDGKNIQSWYKKLNPEQQKAVTAMLLRSSQYRFEQNILAAMKNGYSREEAYKRAVLMHYGNNGMQLPVEQGGWGKTWLDKDVPLDKSNPFFIKSPVGGPSPEGYLKRHFDFAKKNFEGKASGGGSDDNPPPPTPVPSASEVPKFRAGGFTGFGHRDEVAGVVHGQEWVLPAEEMDRIRPQLMAGINEGPGSRVDVHIHGTKIEITGVNQEHQQKIQVLWDQLMRGIATAATARPTDRPLPHNHRGIR